MYSFKELIVLENIDPKTLSISINKSAYKMRLLSGEMLIQPYPVVVGRYVDYDF